MTIVMQYYVSMHKLQNRKKYPGGVCFCFGMIWSLSTCDHITITCYVIVLRVFDLVRYLRLHICMINSRGVGILRTIGLTGGYFSVHAHSEL